MEPSSRSLITGPLQEKIMLLLRGSPQCGKDIMKELGIKSPGTIYPVLDELKRKELVEFREEVSGSVRRKNYELTAKGKKYIRERMTSSARMFCCDLSLYVDTIFRDMKEIIKIRRGQTVLCTLENEAVERFLDGAEVTYAPDPRKAAGAYDIALTFPGMSCLLGREKMGLKTHVDALYQRLKDSGMLLLVEVEKTDNLFARVFFEDIRKLPRPPGMTADELKDVLSSAGFKSVEIHRRSGLLYAEARR